MVFQLKPPLIVFRLRIVAHIRRFHEENLCESLSVFSFARAHPIGTLRRTESITRLSGLLQHAGSTHLIQALS